MSEVVVNQQSSFATSRVDRLIGRVFTLATLLTLVETVMNCWNQNGYLDKFWMGIAIGIVVAVHLFNFVNFWFLQARKFGYLLHGLSYLIAFALWPLQVISTDLFPEGYRPWLWWATGSAAMAVGMYLPKLWAFAYMLFVPISWTLFHVTNAGGGALWPRAIADGFYTALFPGTIVGLVWLLRESASKVDLAAGQARAAEVDRVTQEAQSLERARLDSLLYSSVLGALKLAAKAKDKEDYRHAVEASRNGLERIELAKNPMQSNITLLSFFDTIEKLAKRVDAKCEIRLTGASDFVISGEVASALTDATIQALTNSVQHAGGRASRNVRLKGTSKGLKIVISDNGLGFRTSRVPQHSLGLRLVIFKRVESVGGEVKIDSKPGRGATVILTWEAKP